MTLYQRSAERRIEITDLDPSAEVADKLAIWEAHQARLANEHDYYAKVEAEQAAEFADQDEAAAKESLPSQVDRVLSRLLAMLI